MKSTVYICDGCGKKADGYPTDWWKVERGVGFKSIEAHLCSDHCALVWAQRLAGNLELGRELAPGVHLCGDECPKCAEKKRQLERSRGMTDAQ